MIDWNDFWNGPEDRILLAPMEGVVDQMMRETLTAGPGGIDLCVTEFIRVTDRLLPKSEFVKDWPEIFTEGRTSNGVPVLVQLLGGQSGPVAENARFAAELGALGIDLNFGCPAKTVNRHDGGATLLKNPERVYEVTKAVRDAVPKHLPVSSKVRLGFSDKAFHLEIAKAVEEAGASWLTVHARTRDEGYRPPAHWEFISRMREAISIPVIANGEVWTVEDYHRAREVSGCRHVMIGRGLLADPGLARQIKQKQANYAPWSEAFKWFEDYVLKSLNWRGGQFATPRAKQWLKNLSRRHPQAAHAFEETKRLQDAREILEITRRLCQNEEVGRLNHGEGTNLHQGVLPVL
jgi:tRNA-dihydrouridine synthase C